MSLKKTKKNPKKPQEDGEQALHTEVSNHSSLARQGVPELGLSLVDIGFLSTQISPAVLGYLQLPSAGLLLRGECPGDPLCRGTDS